MFVAAPAGALIDQTRKKRADIIDSGVFTVLASPLLLVSQSFWVVALSQVATAIAGAAIGPAVAGVTLGMVRQKGFNDQNGRNQAFNHAGDMVGAGLSGLLGWKVTAGRGDPAGRVAPTVMAAQAVSPSSPCRSGGWRRRASSPPGVSSRCRSWTGSARACRA